MNNKKDDVYLITGVEDGWIKVDKKVWQEYLKAKEREINYEQRNN